MATNPYNVVGGLKPGRTAFDLSHTKLFDMSIGALVPILVEDCIPGDIFQFGFINTIRAQPLVTPIFHKLDAFIHVFFVPYRLLFSDWEKFVTGGNSGDETVVLPKFLDNVINTEGDSTIHRYGIYDYMGFPIFNPTTGDALDSQNFVNPMPMIDLPWRAYWKIWMDFYRDANIQTVYPDYTTNGITPVSVGETPNEQMESLQDWVDAYASSDFEPACDRLAFRCWEKDYFTSALPWQQRGTSPAIPISGTTSAAWDLAAFGGPSSTPSPFNFESDSHESPPTAKVSGNVLLNSYDWFNRNSVDFTATGVDISDLRIAVQVQKWMERNARAGARYVEFIAAHFGVKVQDERLQRAEYIGGTKQPVVISEILQNSESGTTPQGNMAGHGMGVGGQFAGKYRVPEHGCIIALMSIMPEAIYQQGVERMWCKETRFDFPSPEFAHLSEQEITKKELYFKNDPGGDDDLRFGFQGYLDEYRTRQSRVCGRLANELDDWHMSRQFTGAPSLNEAFLTTKAFSDTRRNMFAVPGVANNPYGQFLVQMRNVVKAIRPLPFIAEPGLLDHF